MSPTVSELNTATKIIDYYIDYNKIDDQKVVGRLREVAAIIDHNFGLWPKSQKNEVKN